MTNCDTNSDEITYYRFRSRANGSYHSCHSRSQRKSMDQLSHKQLRQENKSIIKKSIQNGDHVIMGSLHKTPWWGTSSKYNSQVKNGQKRHPLLDCYLNHDERTKTKRKHIVEQNQRLIKRDKNIDFAQTK